MCNCAHCTVHSQRSATALENVHTDIMGNQNTKKSIHSNQKEVTSKKLKSIHFVHMVISFLRTIIGEPISINQDILEGENLSLPVLIINKFILFDFYS